MDGHGSARDGHGLDADLAAFYDQEAALRARRPIDAPRVARRDEFIARLLTEGRRSVLEVGAGPGIDLAAFAAAGLAATGVDLSLEHARLIVGRGLPAVRASLFALPFPAATFSAGWTMSTLVHVPDARFDEAVAAIAAALVPGAPLAIGLWGGFDREGLRSADDISPPRFFSRRTHDRARGMLARHGRLEHFETWGHDDDPNEYQYAILRV